MLTVFLYVKQRNRGREHKAHRNDRQAADFSTLDRAGLGEDPKRWFLLGVSDTKALYLRQEVPASDFA